jgi:hypothetical protein
MLDPVCDKAFELVLDLAEGRLPLLIVITGHSNIHTGEDSHLRTVICSMETRGNAKPALTQVHQCATFQ